MNQRQGPDPISLCCPWQTSCGRADRESHAEIEMKVDPQISLFGDLLTASGQTRNHPVLTLTRARHKEIRELVL